LFLKFQVWREKIESAALKVQSGKFKVQGCKAACTQQNDPEQSPSRVILNLPVHDSAGVFVKLPVARRLTPKNQLL
jgi:hypothetical protein